jgi:cellulose synthase/poly-beta-1,6-N-acetylglucosamine synthase-like glycosyltransferase
MVAERLIDNIAKIIYPSDRMEIQVLDDSTDETTELCERKAEYYRKRGVDIMVIHRTDRSGFKAGALAEGFMQAKGEFVAIFDADFLPNERFLLDTVPYFQDPHVGVVQTRWGHLNEEYSLFTKLQALQLNVHFTIEQLGRKAGHHFLQFNGTAGIWRKKAIDDAGGWKSDTLTEDLDLSYRAQLNRWEIVYLEEIEAPAELPIEINGIKSQQFRWMKGGAENARSLTSKVLKSNLNFTSKVHAVAHLFNSSIFLAVLMLALLSVPLLPLLKNLNFDTDYLAVSLLGLVGVATVYFYANLHLLRHPWSLRQILALIFYFPLLLTMSVGLSFHNTIAVIEGFLGIKSSFVRTPKYNIVGKVGRKLQREKKKPFSLGLLTEGLLAMVFFGALIMGINLHEYTFWFFHLMLALGFGTIFIVSWRGR